MTSRPEGLRDIDAQVLAAYGAQDREIPDSDLDNEQPITLSVRTTLGEVRRIRRLYQMLTRASIADAVERKMRVEHDETL